MAGVREKYPGHFDYLSDRMCAAVPHTCVVSHAEASVVFKRKLRPREALSLSAVGLILAHIKSLLCFAPALEASCYLFVCLLLVE